MPFIDVGKASIGFSSALVIGVITAAIAAPMRRGPVQRSSGALQR
ncbi:MAG TPA: hypothetical protein VEC06_00930 [Paucimonas sp.]|nr:hypothetical protein [Paucimonas sp.]